MESKNIIIISPKELITTREDLNWEKINTMVRDLLIGIAIPKNLTMPLITPVEKSGYKVGDGNHSVTAMQIAGVKKIKAEVYEIKKPTY